MALGYILTINEEIIVDPPAGYLVSEQAVEYLEIDVIQKSEGYQLIHEMFALLEIDVIQKSEGYQLIHEMFALLEIDVIQKTEGYQQVHHPVLFIEIDAIQKTEGYQQVHHPVLFLEIDATQTSESLVPKMYDNLSWVDASQTSNVPHIIDTILFSGISVNSHQFSEISSGFNLVAQRLANIEVDCSQNTEHPSELVKAPPKETYDILTLTDRITVSSLGEWWATLQYPKVVNPEILITQKTWVEDIPVHINFALRFPLGGNFQITSFPDPTLSREFAISIQDCSQITFIEAPLYTKELPPVDLLQGTEIGDLHLHERTSLKFVSLLQNTWSSPPLTEIVRISSECYQGTWFTASLIVSDPVYADVHQKSFFPPPNLVKRVVLEGGDVNQGTWIEDLFLDILDRVTISVSSQQTTWINSDLDDREDLIFRQLQKTYLESRLFCTKTLEVDVAQATWIEELHLTEKVEMEFQADQLSTCEPLPDVLKRKPLITYSISQDSLFETSLFTRSFLEPVANQRTAVEVSLGFKYSCYLDAEQITDLFVYPPKTGIPIEVGEALQTSFIYMHLTELPLELDFSAIQTTVFETKMRDQERLECSVSQEQSFFADPDYHLKKISCSCIQETVLDGWIGVSSFGLITSPSIVIVYK